jgi:hypothetical protein
VFSLYKLQRFCPGTWPEVIGLSHTRFNFNPAKLLSILSCAYTFDRSEASFVVIGQSSRKDFRAAQKGFTRMLSFMRQAEVGCRLLPLWSMPDAKPVGLYRLTVSLVFIGNSGVPINPEVMFENSV